MALAQEEKREILDVEGAAELLGMGEEAVRRLSRLGRIPGRKVGKEWRYSRERLLRWIGGEEEDAET